MKIKNIKHIWIILISLLFISAKGEAQQKPSTVTNKQAKKEIGAEQKREKEKENIEDKRQKKSTDKINNRAKYKTIPKRKEKNTEKPIG